MLYKKRVLLILCLSFISILPAQNRFFAGINGDLFFSGNKNESINTGFGGGVTVEGGINFGLIDFGLKGSYSKSNGEHLIINMDEYKIGSGVALNIDNNLLSFLPDFINIRPEIVYYADLLNINYYQTESLKNRGFSIKKLAFTSQFTGDLTVNLPKLIYFSNIELVPFVGYSYNIKFDKNALLKSNNAFIGVRLFFNKKNVSETEENLLPIHLSCELQNEYFTPDGNGIDDNAIFEVNTDTTDIKNWELQIFDADKNLFYYKKEKGKLPEQIIWDGIGDNGEKVLSASTYQYVLIANAKNGAQGVTPGVLNVDVFVTEKNGELNITLPSIAFSPDSADFTGLTEEQLLRNKQLLSQVAKILNEYKDYNAEISGHANNVSGTEEENINELIPLSKARAETILKELVQLGIQENRLTSVGKGSDEPLAQNQDEVWKNRRVEILLKK